MTKRDKNRKTKTRAEQKAQNRKNNQREKVSEEKGYAYTTNTLAQRLRLSGVAKKGGLPTVTTYLQKIKLQRAYEERLIKDFYIAYLVDVWAMDEAILGSLDLSDIEFLINLSQVLIGK